MTIPSSFKTKIADTFYDKTISLYSTSNTVDGEGWSRKSSTLSTTFSGNVRMDNLAKLKEDNGLKEEVDLAITCATSVSVAIGNILGYGSIKYEVVGVYVFDSHKLIVCRKWRLSQ